MTDITLSDIQYFLVKQVEADSGFKVLYDSILGVGTTFHYYKGTDLKKFREKKPYMTSYKFNSQKNEGQDKEWTVQFIIGIEADDEPVVDADGITVYESTDKVEVLAIEALDVIRKGLSDGSLNGQCNIRIVSENIIITEVGESDDVQAIVTIRLEDYSIL